MTGTWKVKVRGYQSDGKLQNIEILTIMISQDNHPPYFTSNLTDIFVTSGETQEVKLPKIKDPDNDDV